MNKKKSINDKNEFLNYMLELLEPMELSYKPLFGVYAICKHDEAFALVFDGAVYFKTDTTNRKDYESYSSNPLTYRKQGKTNNWDLRDGSGTKPIPILSLAFRVRTFCSLSLYYPWPFLLPTLGVWLLSK